MKRTNEELIGWLRDAYAMELGMEVALKKIARNDDAPMVFRKLASDHLWETLDHAAAIEGCLQQLGDDTSSLKPLAAHQGLEVLQRTETAFTNDEVIKDILIAYTSEHLEIACYTALQTAAQDSGFDKISATCQRILEQEQKMADALGRALPTIVLDHLHKPTLSENPSDKQLQTLVAEAPAVAAAAA